MGLRRSPVALLLTGAMLAASAGPAAASPPPSPSPSPPADTRPDPASTFTLLSGDTVRLDKGADGSPLGEVVFDAGPQDDVSFQQHDGDLYALPAQAVRLIGLGRLDKELFNLTRLAEYGYDDASVDNLPLIATYPPAKVGQRAATGTAAVPKGAKRTRVLPTVDAASLEVKKNKATETWADLARADAPAQKVWLDGKAKATLDQSVPAVGAPQAWQAGYDGTGVTIAVLDTGIDASHPDFAGRIAASRSFVAGQDVADKHGHGTHVASIAAGSGAAADGRYRGVAPGARLVIGKVLDDSGNGRDSDIIAGMEWAAAQGAKVVNMSLSGGPTDGTDPMSLAVNRISEATGTLFVISAGNNSNALESVATPGAADRALTVGAVDKTAPHNLGWYSSVGPRVLDRAVKPEITAPGTGIVAARAGGTSHGVVVDDRYTSMQGTSMAAPHVAGAVAILAAQHPDWTAERFKDALVSTANPNPSTGLTAQGGGMLDVARATTTPLVATATVHLGAIEPPTAATSGTVTFRNISNGPVRADLALRLFKGKAGKTAYTAPDGAVTVTPSTLDIPAGGTATARITVDIDKLEVDAYYGRLEARTGDAVLARGTVSWSKELRRHRLVLKGIDRLGIPANTADCSLVHILNLDTGEQIEGWWANGRAYTWRYGGPDPLLPQGRYSVLANVCTYTPEPPYYLLSDTVGGAAELVLDGDHEITIDGRMARKLEYQTDLRSEPLGHHDHVVLAVRQVKRVHEDGSISYPAIRVATSAQDIYVVPENSTATTGTFYIHFSSYRVAPAVTMVAFGKAVPALHPWYPNEAAGSTCGSVVLCYPPFDPARSYQVVAAGNGSPAELSTARVGGKLVLVNEVWGEQRTWPRDAPGVDQVAADAVAAGAAGVLIATAYPGSYVRSQAAPTTIPVATLPVDEGQKLAGALRVGPVSVRAGGQPVTPYTYDLNHQFDRLKLPEARVKHRDLETVDARYHSDVPGSVGISGTNNGSQKSNFAYDTTRFSTPHVRTEYHTPSPAAAIGPVHRYRFVVGSRTVYEDSQREHVGGTRVTEDYGTAPVAQGPIKYPTMVANVWAPNRTTSLLPHGGELYRAPHGQLFGWPNTRDSARVIHDGKVLCDWPQRLPGHHCMTPMGAGRYRYEREVEQNVRAFMTAVHTAWDVNVAFDGPVDSEEIVPMVDVRYDVAVNLRNAVTASRPYTATFTPGYQPGYSGPHGRFTVEAWVSNDDGATWRSAGAKHTWKMGQGATFVLPAPAKGAEFVTLRVKATDTSGNSIGQTITRAWKVE